MKRDIVVPVVAGVLALWGLDQEPEMCQRAVFEHGVVLPTCPVGKVRQTAVLEVNGLRRGSKDGSVELRAIAHYTTNASDRAETTTLQGVDSIKLTLIDVQGKATPLKPAGWSRAYGTTRSQLALPEVPDGDYKLQADYATPLGKGTLAIDLPLYTPARVHVITDRPLYEPGNLVKFRAVVLKARDLSPIDGRPGKWIVKDGSGEVLLEEKAPAGDWGIVAGTFPLDKGAPTGTWSVSWVSADASDEASFTVEPFTLPRFSIDAAPTRPFYRKGDAPSIKGAVVYSSGAPVARAALDIQWEFRGDWPPPLDWDAKLLPKKLVTSANGRFELPIPKVPEDLQGRTSITAKIGAVDPAGDRVTTSIPVLLTEEGIQVSSVTELGNGLVDGFNNRMYLRVTTPDGRVVPNAKINVKRVWDPTDKGIDAELDEDGVASLQIDPGPPVNVIVPPPPFRPTPKPQLVTRGEVEELIAGEGASLADQVEMDKWLAALAPCAKWVGIGGDEDGDGATSAHIGFRVSAGGALVTVGGGGSPLARCAVGVVRGKRLPAGAERMYDVTFQFTDPELPSLDASVQGVLDVPEGLQAAVNERAANARSCLPANAEGPLPLALTWTMRAGSKQVELGGWINDPSVSDNATNATPCARGAFAGRITLEEEADKDLLGLVRFNVSLPASVQQQRPQATTMLGYELLVSAEIEGKPTAKLRVQPGAVPHLRLRVSPILAKGGDTITAELIRGPNFSGTLPKELVMKHLKGEPVKGTLDDDRKTTFVIDPKAEGWIEISGAGQRALVYVKPAADLAVTITPGKDRYAPGQMAELAIQTKLAGKGGKAALSLIGVDQSLGQLVTLPGPDAMSRLQPKVGTDSPAFGELDGQALALGRIRGANAAAATVLRVSRIPDPPQLDAVVSSTTHSQFDPVEELTDRFYIVLAELHEQARSWEASAPANEKMRPATMARLWTKALAAVAKRDKPSAIEDAYGRPLKLSRLPQDLLALVDPRAVIVVGTRLPEDVENWSAWVAKEKP